MSAIMRMRARASLGVIGLFAVLSMKLSSGHVMSADDSAKSVIRVEELRQSTVIGKLGIPLGEVAVIDGEILLDESAGKGSAGAKHIQVYAIDGNELKRPVAFWHENVTWPHKSVPPVGAKVRYAVYETGAYQGWPHGDKWRPVPQTYGFAFVSRLAVVHDFADDVPKQRIPRSR